MAGAAPRGWCRDPYRRHDLRYRDGQVWTAYVCDVGVVSEDPVFPVLDDARGFLAPPRPRHWLTSGRRAAALAVGGFLAVVTLAAASAATATDAEPPVGRAVVAGP